MHQSSTQIPIKKGQRFADALDRKDSKIVAARFNGALFDLSKVSPSDGTFEAVNVHSKDGMKILRHSAAHLMAQATLQIYPKARLNAGPPTEDGFYYDIMMDPISSEDLGNIECPIEPCSNDLVVFAAEHIRKTLPFLDRNLSRRVVHNGAITLIIYIYLKECKRSALLNKYPLDPMIG